MEFAVTLPQGGRAAGAEAIRRAATHAEQLGYSHVWVNDHITNPQGQAHPSPFMYDPLMTLATAAAVTSTIGIGGQIIAPYYSPLWLANALASLDSLSDGRLTVAIGVGWSRLEFEALGSTFEDRGLRTNEIIGILRTVWEEDYAPIETEHYRLPPVRILPKPAHRIPIWIAGHSQPGYRRAVECGDGFHGEARVEITPENVAERVARVRAERPEESFVFSVYTWEWDISWRDVNEILRERDIFEAAGVQHIVLALKSPDADSRLRDVERLAGMFGLQSR